MYVFCINYLFPTFSEINVTTQKQFKLLNRLQYTKERNSMPSLKCISQKNTRVVLTIFLLISLYISAQLLLIKASLNKKKTKLSGSLQGLGSPWWPLQARAGHLLCRPCNPTERRSQKAHETVSSVLKGFVCVTLHLPFSL